MSAIDVDKNWQLLINGEWVDLAAGTYDVIDPATTKVVGRAPEASVEQADDAAAAAKGHPSPGRTRRPQSDAPQSGVSPTRLRNVRRIGCPRCRPRRVRSRRSPRRCRSVVLRSTASATTRTPSISTKASLPSLSPRAAGPAGLIVGPGEASTAGVVACITPYNFPVTNVAGKIAPALAAGCTTVIKPAPQVRSASSCSVRRSTPPASRPAWSTS